MTPPPLLVRDARTALDAMERRTQQYATDLAAVHVSLFGEFRQRVQQQFSGNSIQLDDTRRWSQFPGVATQLTDDYDLLQDALYDQDLDLMDEGIDDAMVDGELRELWLLAESGLSVQELDRLPSRRHRLALFLALGVLGVNWQSRRATWRQDSKDRMRRWVRATVVSGGTLDDTLLGYDRMTASFTGRVTGLYGDERARSYGVGRDWAMAQAQRLWPVSEVWITRLDKLVCPICLALHGVITPLQPVTDSHPRCLVGEIVVGHADVSATSKRFYKGPVVIVEVASGQQLTVTPNHPVLTSIGFKPAGALREGDKVVCCDGEQRVRFADYDHDIDVPARVAQVHEAALGTSGMATVEVEQSAEHFHGDGTEGHVANVRTNWVLMANGRPAFAQPRRQLQFGWTRQRQLAVTALRYAATFLERSYAPLAGGMSCPHLNLALSTGHTLPFREFSLTLGAERDLPLPKVPFKGLPGDSSVFSELQQRFPGQVTLGEVRSVKRQFFEGHVYNLQTKAGYYTGNGIVVKNCRCVKIPVTSNLDPTSIGYAQFLADLDPSDYEEGA